MRTTHWHTHTSPISILYDVQSGISDDKLPHLKAKERITFLAHKFDITPRLRYVHVYTYLCDDVELKTNVEVIIKRFQVSFDDVLAPYGYAKLIVHKVQIETL